MSCNHIKFKSFLECVCAAMPIKRAAMPIRRAAMPIKRAAMPMKARSYADEARSYADGQTSFNMKCCKRLQTYKNLFFSKNDQYRYFRRNEPC